MPEVRINKYLADCGLCSRRKADEHIAAGEVKINDVIAKAGDKINPDSDKVTLKGKKTTTVNNSFEYWAVYKPKGYISTANDEFDRRKVTDLVQSSARLYPVGRLDEDSEGLMVLTNDGALTQKLTHPSFENKKYYTVYARQVRSNSLLYIKGRMEKGMVIDGTVMKAKKIESIDKQEATGLIKIKMVLVTGHNRQIRRMCDKIGLEVVKLIRTGVGKLNLKQLDLRPGKTLKIKKTDIV